MASETGKGWVVARCSRFGAWYVVSKRVHATKVGASLDVVDDRCEVVVPWRGTEAATLDYRSANEMLPQGRLP